MSKKISDAAVWFQDNQNKIMVEKGTVMLRRGEVSKYAYLIVRGCLKSYVEDAKGKEHILQFAPENWLISDINSLFNNSAAILTIEAVEDSELILLSRNWFKDPTAFSREDLLAHIDTLRNNIIAVNKRVAMLLAASAEERYTDFLKTYPSLGQRLALKLIASYVGVTPEFLSRIRRKIARKKV